MEYNRERFYSSYQYAQPTPVLHVQARNMLGPVQIIQYMPFRNSNLFRNKRE